MIFYSLEETLWLVFAALAIDFAIGDPKWPTHPVIWIGRLIRWMERRLRRDGDSAGRSRLKGMLLAVVVTVCSFAALWVFAELMKLIHPWLGYAAHAWFISTTVALKGLKDAAIRVYRPLLSGDLAAARERVGWIVGRDTAHLEQKEVVRAAVETVAENTVDAVVAPLLFALAGAAPLAMLYRAANTLDSMVGYKNDKYLYFGWASARLDDGLNWIPARLTGALVAGVAAIRFGPASGARAMRSTAQFAKLHPSPNSGIPESAVAGALGIQLGGTNRYGTVISERAKLGWPLRELAAADIRHATDLLYGTGYAIGGGLLCAALALTW